MARTEDLLKAGRALADLQDVALEQRERPPLDDRLARLRAAQERRAGKTTPGSSGRLALGGGMAALAAAAGWAFWVHATAPIDFAIGPARAPGRVGAWIAAAPGEALPIAFSDGSRIDLAPDARARVVEVSTIGARVVLERGAAAVAVVHRAETRWAIESGPFEVRVIGTRFQAAWNAEEEALTVQLEEGEVAIAGACLREPHRLTTGESVRLSCRDVVGPVGPSTAAPPPASAQAAAPREVASVAASSSAGQAAPPPGASGAPSTEPDAQGRADWRALAREGRTRDAWAAAEGEGIDALLGSLSGGELLELADLARLAGRGAEARRSYAAIRDRFAGSDAAAAAAFHLGRMSFDGSGAYAEAARWFSAYLSERPGGAFAPEATGRLMEAYERGGDRAAARQLAVRYLERWPRGAHAVLAASLVTP